MSCPHPTPNIKTLQPPSMKDSHCGIFYYILGIFTFWGGCGAVMLVGEATSIHEGTHGMFVSFEACQKIMITEVPLVICP